MSLRLGISQDGKMTLGNKSIDKVDSFIYIGSIIGKDGGSRENVKSRIANLRFFFTFQKTLKGEND